ncbi:hypothetical protein BG000_001291 [Podila horticola]|nr:hypothetical protein BG000_001291 [Podila horticola]
MLLKSSSLMLSVLAASLVTATPVIGDYGNLGLGLGGLDSGLMGGTGVGDLGAMGSDYCSTGDCSTTVPVAPVSIVPETDFIPISNVLPIVNVLPVDVNDYSFLNYDLYGNYGNGGYGDYGYGIGGLGGLGGLGDIGDFGLGMGGLGGIGNLGLGGLGGIGNLGVGGAF